MKALSTRIWMDLGGRCVCDKHLGVEASSKLATRPTLKSITTSMTKWQVVSEDDVTYLSNEYCSGGTICESCNSNY